ncbi:MULTISPECIES: hypothetical protein [unclassified Clostridium]|uniref:hypothetical protein n=1 Tax=unclassified Clostridium TaxID=2614128 RepID=UPI00029726E0|nr:MULTISPECIES: hypothetical protein [unclassified Clostridium]EKQ57220.1 MAG: hypothetical protein A370_01150 [Clostridium sp. Maddingley MBC34-26]
MKGKDIFDDKKLEDVKSLTKEGLTESELAKKLNISLKTLNEWKEIYPDLMRVIEESHEYYDDKVEQALLKRALGYEYEETEIVASKDGKTSKAKKIKKEVPPDTNAIIFWLRNRNPKKWRNYKTNFN